MTQFFLYGIKLFVHKWTVVVVQSFGICVVVHGVFVAKTFVFYLLFLAVEVLIMSCLLRKNSAQCKFRRWAIFLHGVCCKNCKNFCLLTAVFRSRSFEHVVFAYVVFAQAKTLQDEFCRWASFSHVGLVQKLQKLFYFTRRFS